MDWSNQPDERLLEALADDPSALAPLYDRHARLVYGLAMAVLGNADEAADLTQEVFLSLCNVHGYDVARGTVGAYLTTVTRTRALAARGWFRVHVSGAGHWADVWKYVPGLSSLELVPRLTS